MLLEMTSVNQRAPSGPTVMSIGERSGGSTKEVCWPPGVTRTIRFWVARVPIAAIQKLPSGPSTERLGLVPSGRSTVRPPSFVNWSSLGTGPQNAPSGPSVKSLSSSLTPLLLQPTLLQRDQERV